MNRLRQQLVEGNREEYGLRYLGLRFLPVRRRRQAEARRQELLNRLGDALRWSAGHTKPHLGELSPGCRRCVAGSWSCLFINARCNASCFYCPTPQEQTDLPGTNNLTFRHPQGYATYLQRLGFSGASLSGGEPLLTPQRTLAFLRAARAALGPEGHLWMYTNGILLTRELAGQLRDAGLDEIRFDIGATGYRLDRIACAAGLIPTVTVEIPAVPEESGRLAGLLPALQAAGVNHLNLHQLRLTPHNYPKLSERGYSFLHGEKVTVLDSELAALEIMARAAELGSPLPVNYCSFVFKHRHQQAAARRRAAMLDCRPWESITPAGYIRRLGLASTSPTRLERQRQRLEQAQIDPALWQFDAEQNRLWFAPRLWELLEPRGCRLLIGYDQASLAPQPVRPAAGWALPLGPGDGAWVQRKAVGGEFQLAGAQARAFAATWLGDQRPALRPRDPWTGWELVPEGLQDYF